MGDEEIKAPPIGIRPKFIWQESRYRSICAAIERYNNANLAIPETWITERNELLDEIPKSHEYYTQNRNK
jgi:hypothetical protein